MALRSLMVCLLSFGLYVSAQTPLDTTFSPEFLAPGLGRQLAVYPDGRILVAGDFVAVGGHRTTDLGRLLADGTPDRSFRMDTAIHRYRIRELAALPDGGALLAGFFIHATGDTLGEVIRLTATGRYDTTFQELSWDEFDPWKLIPTPAGRLLIASTRQWGQFRNPTLIVERYNQDGQPDSSFTRIALVRSRWANSSGHPTATDLAVSPSGSIYVSGYDLRISEDDDTGSGLYRFRATGELDSLYAPEIDQISDYYPLAIATQPVGDRVALLTSDKHVLALDSAGTQVFDYDLYGRQPDAMLYTAGGLLSLVDEHLITLDRTGERTTYGVTGPGYAAAAAVQKNKIITVGRYGLDLGNAIYRTDPATGLDTSFRGRLYQRGTVYGVVPLPDGKLIAAGNFHRVNGVNYSHLVRLTQDGQVDESFVPLDRSPYAPLYAGVVRLSDGRLVVGGSGDDRHGPIELLTPDGRPLNRRVYWPDREFIFPSSIRRLLRDEQDRVYASSNWLSHDYTSSYRELMRYDFSGRSAYPNYRSLAEDVLTDGYAYSDIHLQPDGKLLLSGSTTSVGSSAPAPLTRLTTDGKYDDTFVAEFPDDYAVTDVAFRTDGRLTITGLHYPPSGACDSALIEIATLSDEGRRLPGLDGRFTGEPQYVQNNNYLFTSYPAACKLVAIDDDYILASGNFSSYRDQAATSPLMLETSTMQATPNWLSWIDGYLHQTVRSPGGATYLFGNFDSPLAGTSLVRLGRDTVVATSLAPVRPLEALSLFPNPAGPGDEVSLSLGTTQFAGDAQLAIYQLGSGRLLHSGKLTTEGGRATLRLPNFLPTATYLLRITDQQRVWSARLIYRANH